MLTLRAALIALVLAGLATSAQANVILTAVETSGDVVISGGGILDRDDWAGRFNTEFFASIEADAGFTVGPEGSIIMNPPVDIYQTAPASFTGPESIGMGVDFFGATSGSGDVFGIDFANDSLIVPDAFPVSGDLDGSATWAGETFASLGVDIGSYTWSWGSNVGQSITLNIVPEPSTAALMALGLVGLAARRRSR